MRPATHSGISKKFDNSFIFSRRRLKYGLPLDKLISLATDGASSMCFQNVGVVGLVKNKLNNLETIGINLTGIYCISHQEALCSKSTNERSDGCSR